MIPLSYWLLERLKWTMIPQIQPARAVLFVVAAAVILAAVAAMRAAGERRYWESVLWLIPAYAVPAQSCVLEIVLPNLSVPLIRTRFVIVAGLAALTALAACAVMSGRRWALGACAAAMLLPAIVLPGWGQVRNYAPLHNPELRQVSLWARSSTPKDAIFVFPDAGRGLTPGVFRATALRALYVDWKAGGQANFLKDFAREWWLRWQAMGAGRFAPVDMDLYRKLGIDYIVLQRDHRIASLSPVFENARFVVYATARSAT